MFICVYLIFEMFKLTRNCCLFLLIFIILLLLFLIIAFFLVHSRMYVYIKLKILQQNQKKNIPVPLLLIRLTIY